MTSPLTPKTLGQKWSVLGAVRFHGVVHAIPLDGNYTSEMFEHIFRHIVLPSLPRDSYLMIDNASISVGKHFTNKKYNPCEAAYVFVWFVTNRDDFLCLEGIYSESQKQWHQACKDTDSLQSVSPIAVQNFYRRSLEGVGEYSNESLIWNKWVFKSH